MKYLSEKVRTILIEKDEGRTENRE